MSINNHDDKVVPKFQHIVQCTLAMMPLHYHAFCSSNRVATSAGEASLSNHRNQIEGSVFVTSTSTVSASCVSALNYQPIGGTIVIPILPSDRSSKPYSVSIPALASINSTMTHGRNEDVMVSCFHDNPCKTEYTHRHPGTAMESDVEEDEDISEKYPGYKPGYMRVQCK